MSEQTADEFDKDYWFEMYQGQCAATDEWAKKYRDEVERKADATLLARCAELQRIAEVANAMVGKERDRSEAQAKRIAELKARLAQVEVDAGRYQWLRKGSPKSNRLPHITQYPYQAKIDENRIPQVWDIEGYHPDRLDAAIDAAMKEQTNGPDSAYGGDPNLADKAGFKLVTLLPNEHD